MEMALKPHAWIHGSLRWVALSLVTSGQANQSSEEKNLVEQAKGEIAMLLLDLDGSDL